MADPGDPGQRGPDDPPPAEDAPPAGGRELTPDAVRGALERGPVDSGAGGGFDEGAEPAAPETSAEPDEPAEPQLRPGVRFETREPVTGREITPEDVQLPSDEAPAEDAAPAGGRELTPEAVQDALGRGPGGGSGSGFDEPPEPAGSDGSEAAEEAPGLREVRLRPDAPPITTPPPSGRELTPDDIRRALERNEAEGVAPGAPPIPPGAGPPASTPAPTPAPTPPPGRVPRRVGLLDRIREHPVLTAVAAAVPVAAIVGVFILGGGNDVGGEAAGGGASASGVGEEPTAAATTVGASAALDDGRASAATTAPAEEAATEDAGVLPPGRYEVLFAGTRAPGCSGGNASFEKAILIEVEGLLREDGTRVITFWDGLSPTHGTIENATGAFQTDGGHSGVLDPAFSNPIEWMVEVPGCTATYEIAITPAG